ncbi:MAG: hypothetical protein AMXMBFR13_33670 [Phycisphaerae bacterium]
MRLGIFAKTFVRPTLDGVLDAVQSHGLDCIQFNMSCAGLSSLPDTIETEFAERIGREVAARGIRMAAVSGTFNMAHPDAQYREAGLRRLAVLASACGSLGTRTITLCTGTRDPQDMWRHHPDNNTPEAWRDMIQTLAKAIDIAEGAGVTLAFEPEVSNVVESAAKGRRLLDEIRSPRLKVIMDGANLFPAGTLPRMREILREAFELLGDEIVLVHAKDLSADGEAGHEAAGTGLLDYDCYFECMRSSGFDGPVVLHGLTEAQLPASMAFVRGKLESPGR